MFGLFGYETATQDDRKLFENTRLNIIDEVSFASYEKKKQGLEKLSLRLKSLTNSTRMGYPYGTIPLVFLGDFRQLEAIGSKSALYHSHSMCFEQAITHLVELQGSHRFRNCPVMSEMMPTIRNSGMPDMTNESDQSKDYRTVLNKACVIGQSGVSMPDISEIQFAVQKNKTRCQINSILFKEYLKKQVPFHSRNQSNSMYGNCDQMQC